MKPVHLFALLFLPFIFAKQVVRCNKAVLLFVVFTVIVSLGNAKSFGVSGKLMYYLFGLFIVVIFQNYATDFESDDWFDIACWTALIMMGAVIANDIYYKNSFITFFSEPQKQHPYFPVIIGNHINLESTWLGLLAFFFSKKRIMKWVYAGLNLLISFLYGSRSGMIVAAMVIIWFFLQELPKLNTRKNRVILLTVVIIGLIIVVQSGMYEMFIGRAIGRFLNQGKEIGDIARLKVWSYVGQTMKRYPLGAGADNGLKALIRAGGEASGESNIHNVYLQAFIDFGWLGGALYLMLLIRMFWNGRKELLSNPFLAALAAYCVVSMFQFRGGETIAFFILALYLVTRKPESAGKKEPDLVVSNPFLRKKGEV